jgi:hypothetical protein
MQTERSATDPERTGAADPARSRSRFPALPLTKWPDKPAARELAKRQPERNPYRSLRQAAASTGPNSRRRRNVKAPVVTIAMRRLRACRLGQRTPGPLGDAALIAGDHCRRMVADHMEARARSPS